MIPVASAGARRFNRRMVMTVGVTIGLVALLLYIQWQTVRPNGPVEQDTMCLVSRIGLPCR